MDASGFFSYLFASFYKQEHRTSSIHQTTITRSETRLCQLRAERNVSQCVYLSACSSVTMFITYIHHNVKYTQHRACI